MPVNKRQAKLALSFLPSPKLLILATNSVPARAPALRFWVQHLAKSDRQFYTRLSQEFLVKATPGTGLTIRSSRARFAASALPAMIGASPMPRSGPA